MAITDNPTAPGSTQTAYDVQRAQINKDETRKRAEAQKALKRRLASTGMAQSGGLAEVQSRRLERDLADTSQSRLATADVAELQERTAIGEAEKNRGLTREQLAQQAALTREGLSQTGALTREQMQQTGELTREGRTQDATLAREQMAQTKGLTEAGLNQQATLAREGWTFTAGESAKERAAKVEAQQADFTQQLTTLGMTLGMDREKLVEATRQFNDSQTWDREKVAGDQTWKSQEAINDRVFQGDMARLNNVLQQGNLSFADQLQQSGDIRKAENEAAFNRGQAGAELSPGELDTMSPSAKAAYAAGQSGRTYDDYKRTQDATITFRNTLITQAAEDPATYRRVQTNVANAIAQTGGVVPEEMKPYVKGPAGTLGTGTSTVPLVPEKFEDLAKLSYDSPEYKQYIEENNIKPVNVTYRNRMGKNDQFTAAPNVGDTVLITVNGKQVPVKVSYRGLYNTAGTSDQAYIQYQAPDGTFYHMKGGTKVSSGKGDNNKIK